MDPIYKRSLQEFARVVLDITLTVNHHITCQRNKHNNDGTG